MITSSTSDSYQTPITRLIDEHKRCLARIAELEAALREVEPVLTAFAMCSEHDDVLLRALDVTRKLINAE